MTTLAHILISILAFFSGSAGILAGSTITTIQGSDQISASRAVINANYAALNASKEEISDLVSTTSLPGITSLPALTTAGSLSTVGTITSGTWHGTALTVPFGGTGSTTLASNQILLGNGTGNIGIVSGFGTLGQALVSNGPAVAPTFQSISFDQNANYNLTGRWNFLTASSTLLSVFNTLYVGGGATTTIQGESTGTSTIQGFLNVAGTNSTSTISGNLKVNGNILSSGAIGGAPIYGLAMTASSTSKSDCTSGSGDTCTWQTSCPTGYTEAISGGYVIPNNTFYVLQNYRSASTTWTVQVRNAAAAGPNPLTVYVLCIRNQ